MITVVGAPLGLGILFGLWPLLAYVGYLVAGIWIGEWLLNRSRASTPRERPYLAAVIGLVVLQLVGVVPVLGIVSAIASLFGFGAVLVLGLAAANSTLESRIRDTAATGSVCRAGAAAGWAAGCVGVTEEHREHDLCGAEQPIEARGRRQSGDQGSPQRRSRSIRGGQNEGRPTSLEMRYGPLRGM